jgi:hypothetical protein
MYTSFKHTKKPYIKSNTHHFACKPQQDEMGIFLLTYIWDHIDEIYKIWTINTMWSKKLGCNFGIKRLVDVIFNLYKKCQILRIILTKVTNRGKINETP